MVYDYLNTKREFQFISSRQKVNDIIIFDDYSENFPGIVKLVKDIKNKKNYSIDILSSTEQSLRDCTKIKMKIAIVEKYPFIGNEKNELIFLEDYKEFKEKYCFNK